VYTRRSLLVADGPQALSASAQLRPMHKPPLASAGIYRQGMDTPGGAAPGERTAAVRQYHHRPLAGKESGAPRSSPDAPVSVPSCWSITAFPAYSILLQMNRQPM